MSGLTIDPDDPRLGHGSDSEPVGQNSAYLVLSDEERGRGFVRPVRRTYLHVGAPGPANELRDLTEEEKVRFDADKFGYVKFEAYPPDEDSPAAGRFWTQAGLDTVETGCGTATTMSQEIAETYARQPSFYGSTYCVGCSKHLPVSEFVWDKDGEVVGS